ncbi:MAG: hypothetical protein J6A69_00435 [Clostridia bacterium]|nr:hypothetical protein [Clostridia bacterium]
MADSVLRDKAKQFAKDIVFLCREIKSTHKEAALVNQLLRSAFYITVLKNTRHMVLYL